MRKHAVTFLTERTLKKNDPENSLKKLSECVWELTSGGFKNCKVVKGENKCSGTRWMSKILIIRLRGILTDEVCGPLEPQVKRVSRRTSLRAPEQATVSSCFPDCACFSLYVFLCCAGARGKKLKESFVSSTAWDRSWWKRSGEETDQDTRKEEEGGLRPKERQNRRQCKYKRGRVISLVHNMGHCGGLFWATVTLGSSWFFSLWLGHLALKWQLNKCMDVKTPLIPQTKITQLCFSVEGKLVSDETFKAYIPCGTAWIIAKQCSWHLRKAQVLDVFFTGVIAKLQLRKRKSCINKKMARKKTLRNAEI